MEREGILVRAVSSFYEVDCREERIVCRARGRLRLDGVEPLPGDRVRFQSDPYHEGNGIMTGISPRKNFFVRPSIANLDQIVFVASAARPSTEPYLIDRLSAITAEQGCSFLLCINKADLNAADQLNEVYRSAGLPVILTSAFTGQGLDALYSCLQGKISALTGNSGVGKTSLLNILIPSANRETSELSSKYGRGRHTTRTTELFRLNRETWIADTPGFAALDLSTVSNISSQTLSSYFQEFPQNSCRFPDCMHDREPDCIVRQLVSENSISRSRYDSYIRLLHELQISERSNT